MRDKTKDERHFIPTLFAIALELREQGYATNEVSDVPLSIGLPPAHYGARHESFEKDFVDRDIVDFRLDDPPFSVFIRQAACFPQAPPVDTGAIEVIVRRILEEPSQPQKEAAAPAPKSPAQPTVKRAEEVQFDETLELLGKDGLAATASTITRFWRN